MTAEVHDGDISRSATTTEEPEMVTTAPFKMITDKQRSFLTTLLAEREVEVPEQDIDSLTCRQASILIDLALKAPRKQRQIPAQTAPQVEAPKPVQVPDGRYALRQGGEVKFYRVNSPSDGRWAGWTFVSVLASDTEYPVRYSAQRSSILSEIAKDVKAAFALYGQEIGSCGVCGRTLTDAESRRIGVGPVCAEKIGM